MDKETARAHLNLHTARARWSELAVHFARGAVLRVDPALDLVAVAQAFTEDDSSRVKPWLDSGEVAAVSDEEASVWADDDAGLWTVVVAPWVLVQDRQSGP